MSESLDVEYLFKSFYLGWVLAFIFWLFLAVQATAVARYVPLTTVIPQFSVAEYLLITESESISVGEWVSLTQAGLFVVLIHIIVQLLIAYTIFPKKVNLRQGLGMVSYFSGFHFLLRSLNDYEVAIFNYFGPQNGFIVCVCIWMVGYIIIDLVMPFFTRIDTVGYCVWMSIPGFLLYSIFQTDHEH